MQCLAYARQLAVRYADIVATETEVLVLGIGSIQDAQRYARFIKAPYPILADANGEVYEQFMLDRVFLALLQESAAFVIDKAGAVRYAHKVANPMTWLRPEALTEVLEALNQEYQGI
jgi:peroxiredoxin